MCPTRWSVGKSSGSSRWSSMAKLRTSQSHAPPHVTCLYPDIRVLLLVSCTLPVTSCSSERSFSTLKRIKTYSRSTCGNERLTSLALMHIHRDVPVFTGNDGQVCNGTPPTHQADEHGLVTLCDTVHILSKIHCHRLIPQHKHWIMHTIHTCVNK